MPGSRVSKPQRSAFDMTDLVSLRLPEGAAVACSRPKVTLPKPVGDSISGTTRLSELKSRRKQPEQPVASGSASKFFTTKRSTVPQKAESILVDLVFDDELPLGQENQHGVELDAKPDESTNSPNISVPPSPVCSTIFSSPVKTGSECAGSPVSSPESGHNDGDGSIGGFTSPFERNQDDFERLQVQPPTPSPSPLDQVKDKAVIAPQTPESLTPPNDIGGEERRLKQESNVEIDLAHFYAKEDSIASPISLISDVESDVEETQRETAEQAQAKEERQKQEVRAVAAGWKAKYTFGGMVNWRTLWDHAKKRCTDLVLFCLIRAVPRA